MAISRDQARLTGLLDAFPTRRVAVIGDLIADEFIYGRVARVSREAPVLILQYDSTQILPGGAGNAANNVAALGGRAQIVGLTGKDEAGKRLHASLGHVNTRGLLEPARLLHAGQDAHPRRRRAHGQTADRPHRSGGLERLRCEDAGGIHARGGEGDRATATRF